MGVINNSKTTSYEVFEKSIYWRKQASFFPNVAATAGQKIVI